MKFTLTAPLCLALGFAAGWIAKPNNSETPAVTEEITLAPQQQPAKPVAKKAPQKLQIEDEKPEPVASNISIESFSMDGGSLSDPKMQKMVEDMQKQQSEMLTKKFSSKFDAQIMNLVQELGLDAAQEQKLRDHFAKQLEIIKSANIMSGELGDVTELAAAIKGDNLIEAMSDTLTEEQLQSLEDIQERKKQNRTQSQALRELAKVQQNIDLSEDQKDQVYEILMDEAEEKQAAKTDSEVITDAMMSGMGMHIDTEALGINDMMSVQNNADEPMTQEQIMKAMHDAQQKKVDKKVERFSEILTEEQQQQYRKSIENSGSSIFNMIMQ